MLREAIEQFDGVPRGKVLLAMSGGVDSSVAAVLLCEAGFEVVGCFMRLGSPGDAFDELIPGEACPAKPAKIGKQGCCSVGDAGDARQVAAGLGIPFYVCNFKKDFGRIIDYFVDEYARGRTPNPCVRCNDWLKFGKLFEYADQIGAAFVATGHYARLGSGATADPEGRREAADRARLPSGSAVAPIPALYRGADTDKDQSYVLFGIERARLGRMLLPIGSMRKDRVRQIAERSGLAVFDKPDSYEICFVPDNDYAGLVERRRSELAGRPGPIVDAGGQVVGEHGGHHRFTIGQRRGVGVALGHPIYVIDKDPAANTITIGGRDGLERTGGVATEANWLTPEPLAGEWFRCLAQWRSNGTAGPARARVLEPVLGPTPSGRLGAFEVAFDAPQQAVAMGQAVVLYAENDPNRVLGGGWIEETHRPTPPSV